MSGMTRGSAQRRSAWPGPKCGGPGPVRAQMRRARAGPVGLGRAGPKCGGLGPGGAQMRRACSGPGPNAEGLVQMRRAWAGPGPNARCRAEPDPADRATLAGRIVGSGGGVGVDSHTTPRQPAPNYFFNSPWEWPNVQGLTH